MSSGAKGAIDSLMISLEFQVRTNMWVSKKFSYLIFLESRCKFVYFSIHIEAGFVIFVIGQISSVSITYWNLKILFNVMC